MKRVSMPLAVLISMILSGCNSESTDSGEDAGPQFIPGKGPATTLNGEQRDIAEQAIDALARHLGIARDGIQIDTIRPVNWPDSSIGCPQPGVAYLQVITPGNKITLRADGQIHVVHQAGNHAFVCTITKAVAPLTPQMELVFGPQLVVARKDLAQRLGVPETEIRAASAEPGSWDDASLGCPEPGTVPAAGPVTGWVLKFRHQGREYTYHTDLTRTIPCPPISAQ